MLEREVWHAGSFRWLRQVAALAEMIGQQLLDHRGQGAVVISRRLLSCRLQIWQKPEIDLRSFQALFLYSHWLDTRRV